MILRIVQKELLSHLLTLRFAVGGVCCVLLIASSAYVLTRQFESRLEAHRTAVTDYEGRLQKVAVYSELGQVELGAGEWAQIGLIGAFSAVYIALFVWLGLTVSARCQRSATSLLVLLKEADRNDPESPHVYLVKEGLSGKPVDFRDIPPFTDRLTFGHSVAQMAIDAAILLALCVLLFACAYFSFLRYDAR